MATTSVGASDWRRAAIYHLAKSGAPHRDLDADYCDRCPSAAQAQRLLARFAKLGYQIQLQPAAA